MGNDRPCRIPDGDGDGHLGSGWREILARRGDQVGATRVWRSVQRDVEAREAGACREDCGHERIDSEPQDDGVSAGHEWRSDCEGCSAAVPCARHWERVDRLPSRVKVREDAGVQQLIHSEVRARHSENDVLSQVCLGKGDRDGGVDQLSGLILERLRRAIGDGGRCRQDIEHGGDVCQRRRLRGSSLESLTLQDCVLALVVGVLSDETDDEHDHCRDGHDDAGRPGGTPTAVRHQVPPMPAACGLNAMKGYRPVGARA